MSRRFTLRVGVTGSPSSSGSSSRGRRRKAFTCSTRVRSSFARFTSASISSITSARATIEA
jgi:hypothetical protein